MKTTDTNGTFKRLTLDETVSIVDKQPYGSLVTFYNKAADKGVYIIFNSIKNDGERLVFGGENTDDEVVFLLEDFTEKIFLKTGFENQDDSIEFTTKNGEIWSVNFHGKHVLLPRVGKEHKKIKIHQFLKMLEKCEYVHVHHSRAAFEARYIYDVIEVIDREDERSDRDRWCIFFGDSRETGAYCRFDMCENKTRVYLTEEGNGYHIVSIWLQGTSISSISLVLCNFRASQSIT